MQNTSGSLNRGSLSRRKQTSSGARRPSQPPGIVGASLTGRHSGRLSMYVAIRLLARSSFETPPCSSAHRHFLQLEPATGAVPVPRDHPDLLCLLLTRTLVPAIRGRQIINRGPSVHLQSLHVATSAKSLSSCAATKSRVLSTSSRKLWEGM